MEELILVDGQDRQIGTGEKMQVHLDGALHRAFSIFVFDGQGRMLLQQRSLRKYHSGGLWTNTCCSHPQPGETTEAAAARRLMEEMGFSTPLQKAFEFTYRAELDQGLTENEYDHVFAGEYDQEPQVNEEEVQAYAWREMNELKEEILEHPARFTAWFLIAFPRIEAWRLEQPKI